MVHIVARSQHRCFILNNNVAFCSRPADGLRHSHQSLLTSTKFGDRGADLEPQAAIAHLDAARLYVKRTAVQRLSAARKRKALRENKAR